MASTATPKEDTKAKDTGAVAAQAAQKSAAAPTAEPGPTRPAKPAPKAKAESADKKKAATGGKPAAGSGKSDGKHTTNVFGSLTGLRKEINHLYDGFISGVGRAPALFRSYEPAWRLSLRRKSLTPAVDMMEKEDAITLTAELPGLGEEDIELVLQDGMLTLRGEKSSERKEKTDAYSITERHYGAFERSFRMPENANPDKITATFEKGVLTVTVPCKAAAARAGKKIKIEAK